MKSKAIANPEDVQKQALKKVNTHMFDQHGVVTVILVIFVV